METKWDQKSGSVDIVQEVKILGVFANAATTMSKGIS